MPLDIVSDRDKLFVSRFWKALTRLTGVKLKMSSSFHPETDGSSERTNRTIIQSLRFHVERNQKGWARALPLVRFNYLNTVNASTGFTPFQLLTGANPRIIPPLFHDDVSAAKAELGDAATAAGDIISRVETDVMEAQDNLLLAKSHQAFAANSRRSDEIIYRVGDRVLLSTFHRRREYMQRGDTRVAKFMVRYDGPYTITASHPLISSYTLQLPDTSNAFPLNHSSHLRPYLDNDPALFPSRQLEQPGPILVDDQPEYIVERILDRRNRGRGYQYLVRWQGYGPEHDSWLPGREVNDLEVLDVWLAENNLDG